MQTQIDQILSEVVDSGSLSGVAAVICNSQGEIYQGGFGQTGVEGTAFSVDTVAAIASMTKALTGVAAMQLVEAGRLDLDAPASEICPYLGDVQVLDGFADDGTPVLRAPERAVTLRHLLTHTSGFVYDMWNAQMGQYAAKVGLPGLFSLQKAALRAPLLFDPGERWEYGIGIDWAGQMVEALTGQSLGEYFKAHVTGPMGMLDTGFTPTQTMARRMSAIMARLPDGSLAPSPALSDPTGPQPEFEMGGGGLLSTTRDYAKFLRMMLRRGELEGNRILSPETVHRMASNQMGDLRVKELISTNPALTNNAEFFPGLEKSWGLTFQINEAPAPTGRPAGGLMWAGLTNCYYWIDLENDVAGVFITQLFPFADRAALDVYYRMETAVYDTL